MHNELEVLDHHLNIKRPDFYTQLNLPLSESEFQVLEAKFKTKLPEDLKLLYRWKNGQNDNCYKSFVNNSMFLPLEEALDTSAELTSMIGLDFEIENWWNQSWIPVFHNGGGDYICYDTGGIFTGVQGQLIEFWHADNDRNVIARDLESFIDIINQYYETTEAADFDSFFHVNDLKDFPKNFCVE